MSMWQDIYTRYVSTDLENVFMRGIRGSKATHVDLQTYYNLVNEDLNEKQAESVLAHAKDNYLNKKKVEELQQTLKCNEENERLEKEKLKKALADSRKSSKSLADTNSIYEHTILTLAEKYHIPVKQIRKIMDDKATKDIKKDKNRER